MSKIENGTPICLCFIDINRNKTKIFQNSKYAYNLPKNTNKTRIPFSFLDIVQKMTYKRGEEVFCDPKPFIYFIVPKYCKVVCDWCLKILRWFDFVPAYFNDKLAI